MSKERLFTPYQMLVIGILAMLQFTVILDFMVLSPLGAQLLKDLGVSTAQFGAVVSAYAFSAGISGLLAAGFADRFDRKRLLLFFYAGFLVGTFLCGIAPNYPFLLAARIVTGIFGGVVGAVSFAIITDLFSMEVRGRVMGIVQMAFAVSQIFGLPVGLYFANLWDWHAPFWFIIALGLPLWGLIAWKMQPVSAHLALQNDRSAFAHLTKTASDPRYLRGFATTTLLAVGGFMLMPFGSAFAVNNLGLSFDQLPTVYLATGICSMIAGPLIGQAVDRWGKYPIFLAGSALTIVLVLIFTQMGITPLWLVIVMNAGIFVGVTSRMISSSALMSALPEPADRGAFMGINSSVAQIAGGIASACAGMIVHQTASGFLENYPRLGYIVAASMAVCVAMMFSIHRMVQEKSARATA